MGKAENATLALVVKKYALFPNKQLNHLGRKGVLKASMKEGNDYSKRNLIHCSYGQLTMALRQTFKFVDQNTVAFHQQTESNLIIVCLGSNLIYIQGWSLV